MRLWPVWHRLSSLCAAKGGDHPSSKEQSRLDAATHRLESLCHTRTLTIPSPSGILITTVAKVRLRTRVISLTVLYGAMLIAVIWVLSWRAEQTEAELRRLIEIDSKTITRIEELARNQNAFRNRWAILAADDPSALFPLAERFDRSVLRFKADTGDDRDLAQLTAMLSSLGSAAREPAAQWIVLTPRQRSEVTSQLDRRSEAIVAEARRVIVARSERIDAKLDQLERQARNTKWTALGIAWIIVIISIAIARRTISRVVRPLEDLVRAAEEIAAGGYGARAPIGGDREIARLGEAFNRMAVAVHEKHGEVENRARTDDLTRMPNFRAFGEMISREIDRAARYEYSFGLLVFDLDHFKKYNDSYGHLAGNEALQAVANAIRRALRSVDFPARYGGEEFAAVLPSVDAETLYTVGERVRQDIERIPPIGDRRSLTVSIGGALYPVDGLTQDELFKAADERLYQAKKAGRNRVVTPGGVTRKTARLKS